MTLAFSPEQQLLASSLQSWFADKSSLVRVRDVFEGRKLALTLSELSELGLSEAFSSTDASERFGMQELAIVATECGAALQPSIIAEKLAQVVLRRQIPSLSENGYFTEHSEETIRHAPPGCDAVVHIHSKESFQVILKDAHRELEKKIIDRTQFRESITCTQAQKSPLPINEALLVRDTYSLIKAAEMCGVMRTAVAMTVEYVKTRKQFGVVIGTFQAVQNKIADMHLQTEALQKTVNFAAWAAEHSPDQRTLATLSARILAAKNGATVVEGCIQMHGGIGFTWEHDLHLFLRRAKFLEFFLEPSAEIEEQLVHHARA